MQATDGGIDIRVSGPAAKSIPLGLDENTAGVVAQEMLKEFSIEAGVIIEIEKGIPPGVGLGSSAASAAATALALNELFDVELTLKELTKFAAKGERISAGFEHVDNVAAALYGGFTIVASYDPLDIVRFEPPCMLICVVIPNVFIAAKKTGVARSVLPKSVSIDMLVHNVRASSAMVAGFALGDVELIGRSMNDAVVEPARASLVPGYHEVKKAALKAGAYGIVIAGAGPSMAAIVNEDTAKAERVAKAMKEALEATGVKASQLITRPGKGACVIK